MLKIVSEKRIQEMIKEAQNKAYEQERLERRFKEVYERIDNLYKRVCVIEDRLSSVSCKSNNTEVRS